MIQPLKTLCLFLVVTSLAIPVFSWTEDWQSIRNAADKVRTIRSGFTQEKHLPLLKTPLISSGFICFEKPGSLRWEYRSPVASVLMTYRGDIKRFIKRNDSWTEDIGAHLEAMQVVMEEIGLWLSGRFDQSTGFSAALEKPGQIILTPRNKQMAELISSIRLDLSGQPGLIDTVTIFETKTSFTRLTFENTVLNEPVDSSLFLEP